jgi:mycofactocin glycosyltransferase
VLPPGFGIALDPAVRRPRPEVLVGGAPVRVLRLTRAGAAMVDAWAGGGPIAPAPGAQALAGRLLDAGIGHPRPGAAPRPGPDDVTVVVPVRDDHAGLAATLDAIGKVGSVIVVDDGSVDPVAAGEAPEATLIRRAFPGGPGAARNAGWRSAGTEIVLFVDADCLPAPGYLTTLLAHFADPRLAAVAPRIVARAGTGTPSWLAAYEKHRSPLDLGCHEAPVRPGSAVPFVPTAALALRREALEQAGGFDEALRFGEDVDLVWRLGKRGWRVRYDPSASVSHPARRSVRGWLRQRFQYGRSAAPLAARHGRDVAPLALNPWSLAVWSLVVTGRPVAAAAVAAGTSATLAHRAGPDRATARTLAGLALTGNVRAGASLAEAIRRAWLPPALILAVMGARKGRPSAWPALAAALTLPAVVEWLSARPETGRAETGLLAWTALSLTDDLAYQAGIWSGAWTSRSAGPLLPRF